MRALDPSAQHILFWSAQWISALVVNVNLRELLLFPLIRDQLNGGADFYSRALHDNDDLRVQLRAIRYTIYHDASSTLWYDDVSTAHRKWLASWEKERKEWQLPLSDYLRHVQVSTLRDICATHSAGSSVVDPKPPTTHELNYGQQLIQMFEIQYANMVKTGNLQGVPRPRQEVDWVCPDGFDSVVPERRPVSEIGHFPKPTGFGEQRPKQEPEPVTSPDLPPLRPSPRPSAPYLPFGTNLTRLTKLPDAPSAESRAATDALILQHAEESKEAHRRARLKYYGSELAEQLATRKALIASAADKAVALKEFLLEDKHTTDLEGSYYYDEVTLAFRCHGTHWESLSEDITPVGEHYLLIHYDVMYFARLDVYRLNVYGCVERALTLSLTQIQEMAKDHTWTMPMTMECSGNGRNTMKPRYNRHVPWGLQAFGCYNWTGMPLRFLLQQVGVTADCVDVVFTGYDAGLESNELRYFQHALSIHDAAIDHSMLCWMHNGIDLLPNHGAPLRLMVPGWYGNINVKWLQSIQLINRRFKGVYQRTYSYSQMPSDNDLLCPSQELRPHAMLKPMGFPDFTTRKRSALQGKQQWVGKAWVGGGHYRAVLSVDLSLDDGNTWLPCKMEPRLGIFGWLKFTVQLELGVGMYSIRVRATDNMGFRQTVQLDMWNWASMQDDAMQKIDLIVVDGLTVTE